MKQPQQTFTQEQLASLNAETQQAYTLLDPSNASVKDTVSNVLKRKPGESGDKATLYKYASLYAIRAINTLVALLDDKSPKIQLGAASILLDKALPDLKAVEVDGEIRNQLQLNVVQYGAKDMLTRHLATTEAVIDASSNTPTPPVTTDSAKDTTGLTTHKIHSATRQSHSSVVHDASDTPTPLSEAPIPSSAKAES